MQMSKDIDNSTVSAPKHENSSQDRKFESTNASPVLDPKLMITSNHTVKTSEGTNNNLFGSFNVIFEDINNEVNTSNFEKET